MKAKMSLGKITPHKRDTKQTLQLIEDEIWDTCVELMEEVMFDSQIRVPFETGTLQSSAHIKVNKKQQTIEVTYGVRKNPLNPERKVRAREYAVLVHEDASREPKTGERKFLENAFTNVMGDFENVVKDRIGDT